MQRKKYLAKNTLLFAFNSIGTKLIVFFLVPLYTKAFNTSEYGEIDLITTISTILIPIITMNIGESVMRFSLDDDSDQSSIMSVGLLFAGLSIILGGATGIILMWFPQISIKWYWIYLFCITQGIYQVFSCNLRGQEKLLQYAIGNIIVTSLAALLNILFIVILKVGVKGYFYGYILSYLIAGLYCIIAGNVFYLIGKFKLNVRLLKDMVKYSIVLVPNSLMWWIMNSSDHIMVTKMISISANGIYAISYKLPTIISTMSSVFNQAWSYSAIHENKSSDREQFNNLMFDKLVRFQLIITVVLMSIIKPFLKIYLRSSEYYDAWKYTPYLLIGMFFMTIGTFLSTSYTVNKDSKGFLYSGSVGAILNILLNAVLIPLFGVHGAAFATCFSYIIVFVYRFFDTQKYIIIEVFKKEYVIGYVILLMTGLTMYIPNKIGMILLLIEVICILLINRIFLHDIIRLVAQIIKTKVIKRKL